jgi:L-asparaginase
LVIHTGGTLGMAVPDGSRLDLAPAAHLQRLLGRVPELQEIAEIALISPWNLDSSDVTPGHWRRLAELVAERGRAGDVDGVVIIHGTDTLAYAASALAFALRGLDRPVVFTGSQRPLEAWRTDARANLTAAVECATRGWPEVLVVFGDVVLRGCRSTKADAMDYQAFATPAEPPLGRIGVALTVDEARVRRPREAFRMATAFDPRVLALTVFPGFDPAAAAGLVDPGRVRAVVVRAFGLGNVPQSLAPLVRGWVDAGIGVVVTSQCHRGHTRMPMYAGGRALLEAGAVEGRDLTFEAAVVKTMWALAQPQHDLRGWLATDLAGEATFD